MPDTPNHSGRTDLGGRVAIVTGSSSGIGEAIARRLAAAGCSVVVNSSTSVDAGQQLADSLPDAIYVQGDISDPATGEVLVTAAIERWGRLDGLVNNAGVTLPIALADFDKITAEDWDTVLRTNVIGTFLVTQAALGHLRASDDAWVVNIGSIAGERAVGSSMPYSVSKAALAHLTTLLGRFVGPEIRINNLAPGLVDTPWTSQWDALRAGVQAIAPLRRTGTPDDMADACMALIDMKYVTGQTLLVDGGLSLVT